MAYECTECYSRDLTLTISNLAYPSKAKSNETFQVTFDVTYHGDPYEYGDAEVYYNIIDTKSKECLFKSSIYTMKEGETRSMSCYIKMPSATETASFKLSVKEEDMLFDDCGDFKEFTVSLEGIPEPPPYECRTCTTKKKDAVISEILANPQVIPGDDFSITVTVEAKTLLLDIPIFLTVYDKKLGGCRFVSDTKLIEKDSSETWTFVGTMPDYDMHLKVSAIDDTLIFKDCQDYKEFVIKKGETTEPPEEPEYLEPSFWDQYFIYIFIGLIILIGVALYLKYKGKIKIL